MTKEEKNKILADKNSSENATAESAQKAALSGVDKQYTDKVNSTFTASDTYKKADTKVDAALFNYERLTGDDQIVDNKTKSKINSTFKTPKAVTEADAYLKGALSKIQSGKTSYSDSVREMMDKISGRDKFSYDVDNDPLFQQALASAMNSGKSAMQDTIGQASALTGGYGSSYATSAANQAYNAFIEDAYDNLPQYYQMALDAYNAEGDELYRQLDMFNTADEKEYGRILNAYDATGTYRDRLYNEAYQQFRDSKSDAFASANLQISEHGQLSNDALNLYNAYANEADKMYEREYQKWSDEVDNAMQYAQMLNSEYWNQTNFDEGVRQFDQNFTEEQRQFDEKLDFEDKWNQTNFDEGVRQFDQSLAEEQRQFNAQIGEQRRQFNARQAGDDNTSEVKSGYKEIEDEEGNKKTVKKNDTTQKKEALKAYNSGGTKALKAYLASLSADYDIQGISDYAVEYGEDWVYAYDKFSGFTIKDDTTNGGWFFGTNWFGGKDTEDHNDTYSRTYDNGKTYTWTYNEMRDAINASNMPKEKKEELLEDLKQQSKK